VGFELRTNPTKVSNFRDDEEVKEVYYREIEDLVKEATGASKVFVFDHTVRKSSVSNLNAAAGGAAGSVVRVHCDYDVNSAPRRFRQLCKTESYTGVKLSEDEVEKYINGRYSFVNVWRNIKDTPVQVKPLAVCDTNSVPVEDHLTYNMMFPERHGSNYCMASETA